MTSDKRGEKKGIEYKDPCKKGCLNHRYHCGDCNRALSYSPANYCSRPADIPNPCPKCNAQFYQACSPLQEPISSTEKGWIKRGVKYWKCNKHKLIGTTEKCDKCVQEPREKKMKEAEQDLKNSLACAFRCGDGAGTKVTEHYAGCPFFAPQPEKTDYQKRIEEILIPADYHTEDHQNLPITSWSYTRVGIDFVVSQLLSLLQEVRSEERNRIKEKRKTPYEHFLDAMKET